MNSSFKSIIFTLIGLAIFFVISWLFISIVPYLLLGGLIIYIIVKVKKNFNNKNKNKNNSSSDYNRNENVYNNSNVQADYYDRNEKVIDVDYKEMD